MGGITKYGRNNQICFLQELLRLVPNPTVHQAFVELHCNIKSFNFPSQLDMGS